MAIGHLAVRAHSRKRGHSAAAGLAYRHGARLVNRQNGSVHDYRYRVRPDEDVVAGEGMKAPWRWTGGTDLQFFADAIEKAEKRKDAQLFRDVQIALPHELVEDRQIELAAEYAFFLVERYDTPTAWAVHRPGKNEPRNVHVHICLPTRRLNEGGDGFSVKLRQLSILPDGAREITLMRNEWQDRANQYLAADGFEERVHVGRRLDSHPEPTLPRNATAEMRERHKERLKRFREQNAGRKARYAPKAKARITAGDDVSN